MPRTRPPYPPEFRREAVALVRSGPRLSSRGRPIAADVLPADRREEVTASRLPAVRRARRLARWLLRLEGPPGVGAPAQRRRADLTDRRGPCRKQRHLRLAAGACRVATPRRPCE